MSTIDLRDAFHTLTLAKRSQKYCGITSYYGSPTYHYLHMGMGMCISPQIWQQFVDLVFQDDIIKRKQNLKDKCEAIRNLESPKTSKQTRAFCGMVKFLSSFLPNLR